MGELLLLETLLCTIALGAGSGLGEWTDCCTATEGDARVCILGCSLGEGGATEGEAGGRILGYSLGEGGAKGVAGETS